MKHYRALFFCVNKRGPLTARIYVDGAVHKQWRMHSTNKGRMTTVTEAVLLDVKGDTIDIRFQPDTGSEIGLVRSIAIHGDAPVQSDTAQMYEWRGWIEP